MKVHANERRLGFTLFMVFSTLLLSIVPLYRLIYHGGWPSEENSYYHMRMAEYLLIPSIPSRDPGVVSETLYFFNPYDLLLGLFSTIFNSNLAALLVPLLLGIVTLYFTYILIAPYFSSSKNHLLAGIFLVTCPLCLTIFSQATEIGFIACIFSISMYIILKTEKYALAYILLPLLSFYGVFHSIIISWSLFYFCYHKKKQVWILTGIIGILSILLFFYRQEAILIQLPALLLVVEQILSDLGGNYGFSIFAILLTVLGISEQKIIPRAHIVFVALITLVSVYISPIYYFYLIPYLAVYATFGFFSLLQREWKLHYLQNIALFLLILGILFSATSTISRNATRGPSPAVIQGLLWLEENSFENSIIFTDKQQGFFVEQISRRRAMFDKNTLLEAIPEDVYSLFRQKNTEETLHILEEHQIDYVILFPETPHPQLLLILKSTENFKKVFENSGISIWSVQY